MPAFSIFPSLRLRRCAVIAALPFVLSAAAAGAAGGGGVGGGIWELFAGEGAAVGAADLRGEKAETVAVGIRAAGGRAAGDRTGTADWLVAQAAGSPGRNR